MRDVGDGEGDAKQDAPARNSRSDAVHSVVSVGNIVNNNLLPLWADTANGCLRKDF